MVYLTLGSKGVKLSQNGKVVITLPAIKIKEIKDATGVGDTFWSGFLFTYLRKKVYLNVCRLNQNIQDFSELLKIKMNYKHCTYEQYIKQKN